MHSDQDRRNVGPDLDPNCLTLMVFLKEFVENDDFEMTKTHEILPSRQRIIGLNIKQSKLNSKRILITTCTTIIIIIINTYLEMF